MTLLRKTLAGAILTFISYGAFAGNSNYFNAQLALAQIDDFDDGLALAATYGIPMPKVHKNFSLEGEVNLTIADAETTVIGTSIKASYYSVGAYGVYTVPISDKFNVIGRAGLIYISLDAKVGGPLVVIDSVDDGFKFSYGVGVAYGISEKMSLIAGYTSLSSDVSQLSAGVQFQF